MKKIFFIVVLLIVAAGVLVFSPGTSIFEETAPKIEIENEKADTIYYNPKKALMRCISTMRLSSLSKPRCTPRLSPYWKR